MALSDPVNAEPFERLDIALVARGLTRSRQTAAEAIRAGRVHVNGVVARKPAAPVRLGDALVVEPSDGEHYVSRAAHKLAGALDAIELSVSGTRCIDVGASTGGFTQVLLERGAAHVSAIDVGTGQLVPVLRADPRVTCLEGTHVGRDDLAEVAPASLVVADLSFISLCHVMGALAGLVADGGALLPMVKPQFEVGRTNLGKGGVVNDPVMHREAVAQVIASAGEHGFFPRRILTSTLPGPSGNIEFFVYLDRVDRGLSFDDLWAGRDSRTCET